MARTIAVFPGTFDPPHLGHLDTLNQAVATFDQVYWVVGTSGAKVPMFPLPARTAMMLAMAEKHPDASKIVVADFPDLLVDYADSVGATHIVRSLRMGTDFEFEYPMTLTNRHMKPGLITVYFPAFQEHMHISSTAVRELIRLGKDPEFMVGPTIAQMIRVAAR